MRPLAMRPLTPFHPREEMLHRFADGMLPRGDQARLAAHLADCDRCRGRVDFARDVGAAARRLDVPEPDGALLDRVLADRAAGARVPLPTARPSLARRASASSRLPHGVVTLGVTLGAAAAILLAVRVVTEAVHAPLLGPRPGTTAAARGELRDPPGIFTNPSTRQGIPTPELPPARLDGTRLHGLRATYAIRRPGTTATRFDPDGRILIDVAPRVVDGVPTWRVVRRLNYGGRGTGAPRSETVHLAVPDLRLLDRTEEIWWYRQYGYLTLSQQLAGTELSTRLSFEQGLGRRVQRELPASGGPYLSDALAPIVLMAVPLQLRWAGSVSMLRWGIEDDDVASRVAMRVTGDERVEVPAGTFDCWRLTVMSEGRVIDHWVRKSDGLAVKMVEPAHVVELASVTP